MKILFDQCVPHPLRPYLKDHDVFTAKILGWGRLKNGELLSRAEREGFHFSRRGAEDRRGAENGEGVQVKRVKRK